MGVYVADSSLSRARVTGTGPQEGAASEGQKIKIKNKKYQQTLSLYKTKEYIV